MAAEGGVPRHSYQIPQTRQWGRGRMAAEGGGRPSHHSLATSVNGAAAGWPRKVNVTCLVFGLYLRQWGRGRMAAEGSPAPCYSAPTASVNGAAAGWPRKAVGSPAP